MKTLGLIGGMSSFSTSVYYSTINRLVNERLGGAHAARLILYSVDLHDFKTLVEVDEWDKVEEMMTGIAQKLKNVGADCIMLCSNTPHVIADAIEQQVGLPLIHIADATAEAIAAQSLTKVGLLGTTFTMERPFFIQRLKQRGIETIVPNIADKMTIHNSIANELTQGVFRDETKQQYLEVIGRLRDNGAQGVILGCTEIPMFISQSDCPIPAFDTTYLHSAAAVAFALGDE